MRIELKESGGFAYVPTLAKPVGIEEERLGAEEVAELRRLVEAAKFFDLPASIGVPRPGAADYQTARLTIEDSGRSHTVQVIVPAADPALRELVARVSKIAARVRSSNR